MKYMRQISKLLSLPYYVMYDLVARLEIITYILPPFSWIMKICEPNIIPWWKDKSRGKSIVRRKGTDGISQNLAFSLLGLVCTPWLIIVAYLLAHLYSLQFSTWSIFLVEYIILTIFFMFCIDGKYTIHLYSLSKIETHFIHKWRVILFVFTVTGLLCLMLFIQ